LLSSCKKFSTCIIQIVIEKQLPLEIQDNLEARLGAARTVHHIISELDCYFTLDRIFHYSYYGDSDISRQVRVTITYSFATLICLMPPESGIPNPVGMAPELVIQKQKERHLRYLSGQKLFNLIYLLLIVELRLFQIHLILVLQYDNLLASRFDNSVPSVQYIYI